MTQDSLAFFLPARLPGELRRLGELAYNLWWSWDKEASNLFQHLDAGLWEETHENPALVLASLSQKRLRELAEDRRFLASTEQVCRKFDGYMASYGPAGEACIAYFSPEVGLTGCLPLYAGGLGILAGDHLKSASDLGLPLVGVSLLYQEGYFSQHIGRDGRQREFYPNNDFHTMPIQLQRGKDDAPVTVKVPCGASQVAAQV